MSQEPLSPTSLFSAATEPLLRFDEIAGELSDLPNIPNYKLEKIIGRGGFGRVFRASRDSDNKLFAIKLLRGNSTLGTDLRQRFLREATVLCQLEHPRIVSFRELGIAGNDLYIVMDYVDSIPWRIICQTLSPPKRISVAVQIVDHCLEALVYAHSKGIVHRDIKPSNILLENRAGKLHVWLADFGLAKNYLQAGHSGVTSDNEVAGTLSYLAPELLQGIKFFKPASDQYSLAATLYEMLSGQPPIVIPPGGNPLLEIRRHRITPIQELAPAIPSRLSDWIHCGLATAPADRFESMQNMRDSLNQLRTKT